MKLWVGVTDYNWFRFQAAREPDELNFWQPSPNTSFKTVNHALRIEVSPRIRSEYENGRVYYALHGQPLAIVPANSIDQPGKEFLEYHNTQVFRP